MLRFPVFKENTAFVTAIVNSNPGATVITSPFGYNVNMEDLEQLIIKSDLYSRFFPDYPWTQFMDDMAANNDITMIKNIDSLIILAKGICQPQKVWLNCRISKKACSFIESFAVERDTSQTKITEYVLSSFLNSPTVFVKKPSMNQERKRFNHKIQSSICEKLDQYASINGISRNLALDYIINTYAAN